MFDMMMDGVYLYCKHIMYIMLLDMIMFYVCISSILYLYIMLFDVSDVLCVCISSMLCTHHVVVCI